MATYYQVNVRFQKEDETGRLKTLNEAYLFDALSYTEAEAKGYENIVTDAQEFSINTITRMRLADLLQYPSGESWYKARLIFFSVDDKSGKEKKISNLVLVNADDFSQALDRIVESHKNMLVPYEVTTLALTPILDFYPYQSTDEDQAGE